MCQWSDHSLLLGDVEGLTNSNRSGAAPVPEWLPIGQTVQFPAHVDKPLHTKNARAHDQSPASFRLQAL